MIILFTKIKTWLKNKLKTFKLCPNWKNACSCFISKLFGKDWEICCKQHDEDYKNLKPGDSTKRADLRLLSCVRKRAWRWLAYMMYGVVRILGRSNKGE